MALGEKLRIANSNWDQKAVALLIDLMMALLHEDDRKVCAGEETGWQEL